MSTRQEEPPCSDTVASVTKSGEDIISSPQSWPALSSSRSNSIDLSLVQSPRSASPSGFVPPPILHPDLLQQILKNLPRASLPVLLRTHSYFTPFAGALLYSHVTVNMYENKGGLALKYIPDELWLSPPRDGLFRTVSRFLTAILGNLGRDYWRRSDSLAQTATSYPTHYSSEPSSPSFWTMPHSDRLEPEWCTELPHTRTLTVMHTPINRCHHRFPPRIPQLDTLHLRISDNHLFLWSFCRPPYASLSDPNSPASIFCPLLVHLQPRRMIFSRLRTIFSITPFGEWPSANKDRQNHLLGKVQEVVVQIDVARWVCTATSAGGDFLCSLPEHVEKVTIIFDVVRHMRSRRGREGKLLEGVLHELLLLGVSSNPGTRRKFVIAGLEELVRREQVAKANFAQNSADEPEGDAWTEEMGLKALKKKMAEQIWKTKSFCKDVRMAESLPDRIEWVTLNGLRAKTDKKDEVMCDLLGKPLVAHRYPKSVRSS